MTVRLRKAISSACCTLFLFFVCISSGVAQTESNKVHWVLYEFPPYVENSSDSKYEPAGEGATIEFLKHITIHMSDFQHEFEVAGISRIIGMMKNGVLVCNPLLLKVPERESFIEFSYPVAIALSHHVVVTTQNYSKVQPYLDHLGKVDLTKLVTNTELSTSITNKRAYPLVVTRALEKAANPHSILKSSDLNTPFKQLLGGRIDYVVAYPFEVQSYSEKTDNSNNFPLEYVPIAGIPEFALARVGCTKGTQGEIIIQRMNQIILEAGAQTPWYKFQIQHSDSATRKRIESIVEKYQPFKVPEDY